MPASEADDIRDASEDEDIISGRRKGAGTRSRGAERDFEVTRTWDQLIEGADGTITSAVEDLLEAGKRRRYLWPIETCCKGY